MRVDGLVERSLDLDFAGLAALPGQIDDVGAVVAGREGGAVPLAVVLEHAGVRDGAVYLTVRSSKGDFSASVPLDAVADAVLVYRLGTGPLPSAKGGPVRFLIPDAASCRTAEVDTCANVKFVASLSLGREPGRDTRPTTARSHKELHEKPGHEHSS